MILTIFAIGVIFGSILLFLGARQESFPMVYLSMFMFLIIGLFLMSDGLTLLSGQTVTSDGVGGFAIVDVLTTHTTANDPMISILANVFFYIPLVGLLMSTFFALKGFNNRF